MTEVDLAWQLAKVAGAHLTPSESHYVYAAIGSGETFCAIVKLLLVIVRERLTLPAQLFAAFARWLGAYEYHDQAAGLRALIVQVKPSPRERSAAAAPQRRHELGGQGGSKQSTAGDRPSEVPVTTRQSTLGERGDPFRRMSAMLCGQWVSQAIRAIADLSIPDHLSSGGLTSGEVADREGSSPDTTFRLMRAGVALGLLTAGGDGRFHSTPLLDTLRRDAPRSLRNLAVSYTNVGDWLSWQELVTAVRTGKGNARYGFGLDWFDHLETNTEDAREYCAAIAGLTCTGARDAISRIDTANVQLAIAVGDSTGRLLQLLQKKNPTLCGIAFERPIVAADEARGPDRKDGALATEAVIGDFSEWLPAGDLYLLKHVLHNWDDDSCVKVLSRCREAMLPGGRVLILELLVGEITDPGGAALMDLRMLAATNGRERSLQEYDLLLASSSLERTAVLTSQGPLGLIEARAA